MARNVTFLQLRTDAADRAAIQIDDAGRHTSTKMKRRVNQAIQRFRLLATKAGHEHYLKRTTVSTSSSSTPDANGWEPREFVSLPSDFVELVGADLVNGSESFPMLDAEWIEGSILNGRMDWVSTLSPGMPRFFRLGGTSAAGANIMRVFPKASAVYSIVVYYLPAPADLVADGDTFDGIAGLEEWVVNRVAMDCLLADNLASSDQYAALAAENREHERQLQLMMANKGPPARRVDTGRIRQWLRSTYGVSA